MNIGEKMCRFEEKEQNARARSRALISVSHHYFQRSERSTSSLKLFFYRDIAWTIQRQAIRDMLRASRYMEKYIEVRQLIIDDIKRSADYLGYRATLERT